MPEFTPDQLSAIAYRRSDVCVVAGPGSGKTTVLVERYRKLIDLEKFDAREILAITFTEKAAANMKAKLAGAFEHDAERRRELESSAWVSTVHGFCMKLLRENAIAAGLDPRFSILSPREAERLQRECVHFALDAITEARRTETLAAIEALHQPYLGREIVGVYDGIRSAGMSIAQVRGLGEPSPVSCAQLLTALNEFVKGWPFKLSSVQMEEKSRLLEICRNPPVSDAIDLESFLRLLKDLNPLARRVPSDNKPELEQYRELLGRASTGAVNRHVAPFRALIFDALALFDDEYRKRKQAVGRVDFNDLERYAIALLRDHPDIRERVQKQFRQVMLDEFQDVNGQQAELIRQLRSEGAFFGVGDRNQSIYGFRHARPDIFANYQREVSNAGAQLVDLRDNFRSRNAILTCVRALLGSEAGIEDRELIANGRFAAKDEPCIEVLKIMDFEDRDAARSREAAWIAHRVCELEGNLRLGAPGETRPAEFRDFAVLCRGGDSMTPILEAFDRAGVPYVCGRRASYLLSRTGRDVTALLRVVANPRDSISLATVLRGPFVALSDEGLLQLRLLAGSLTGGLNKLGHDPHGSNLGEGDRLKAIRFHSNLDRWRTDQPIIALDTLLARALADCGVDWCPETLSGADIEAFLYLARTTGAAMDLPSFLREIESLADADNADSELSDEDQGNRVQVMTAHAAKGLEFGITIIAAMDKGTRLESGPMTFTPDHGLGLKWRNPLTNGTKDELKDSWAEANKLIASAREKEEGNRLLYVAMTRAEEHLILTYCAGKGRPGNWANLVEQGLGLQDAAPSGNPVQVERNGCSASVLITTADPPSLTAIRDEQAPSTVLAIPHPTMEDQHDTSVAVTSLAVFGACPRKYYIQRSLGWSTGRFRRFDPEEIDDTDIPDLEDNADPAAARIGTAVHEILADLTPAETLPEAQRLAEVFRRGALGIRAAASTRVAREWEFESLMEGTIVRGTIDLWFEEDGALHVVDYKTDDVKANEAESRAAEYAPQLALYALALERSRSIRPRSAWLHFLRPDVIIEVPLNEDAVASAIVLIKDLRTAQDDLHFPLNEGPHCRRCQFFGTLCPAGRPTTNAAESELEFKVAY